MLASQRRRYTIGSPFLNMRLLLASYSLFTSPSPSPSVLGQGTLTKFFRLSKSSEEEDGICPRCLKGFFCCSCNVYTAHVVIGFERAYITTLLHQCAPRALYSSLANGELNCWIPYMQAHHHMEGREMLTGKVWKLGRPCQALHRCYRPCS